MKFRKVAWAIVKLVFSIVIMAVILMLIYRFSFDSYDFGYRIFAEEPVSPAPGVTISVAIVEGKSTKEIGEILEEKGLIRSAALFFLQERFSSYHGKLQPGIYELSTAMTPEEMMAIMAEHYGETPEETEDSGNSETSSYLEEEGEWTEGEEGSSEPSEELVIEDASGEGAVVESAD